MGSQPSKPETAGGAQHRNTDANTPHISSSSPGAVDSQKLVSEEKNETSSEGEISRCPMRNQDGTYSYNWLALFRPSFPHGPGGKKPLTEQEAKARLTRRASVLDGSLASPGGGCPVRHQEYNVYSQPIDPKNNMPENPNQLPAAAQTKSLSTDRVRSNIPKGGAANGATWTYPSPQMFYNALARKGKLGDTREKDIDSVVALHNNMNEKTWKKVLEWEQATTVAGDDEDSPKLLRFMGRPKDLSPKAWLKHNLMGHPLPFDRHDWTILRSDGTTARYVIDYYHDETRANEITGGMPDMDDASATPSLLVDVRPALDGPLDLWNRAVTMPRKQLSGDSTYQYMPLWPTPEMKGQVRESTEVWKSIQSAGNVSQSDATAQPVLSDDEAQALVKDFRLALSNCAKAQRAVDSCESDNECTNASLDLTLCMGKTLCPLQHASFADVLAKDDDSGVEASLERLSECVLLRTAQHKTIKRR